MDGENEERGLIFDDVKYAIIPADDLSDAQTKLLRDVLSEGATECRLGENGSITNLNELTHIITTNVDFPEYSRALDLGIEIVKPSWVQNSVRKGKMTNTRPYSPDPNQYFSEVVMTSANLTDGDKDALVAGVLALGGQYSGPLTKLTTHVVTIDMDHEKCKVVQAKGLSCKVVLPHWFDACLRLGKRIKEEPYMFPNPAILHQDDDRPLKIYPSPYLEGASTDRPSNVPSDSPSSSPSEVRKNLNAFMGKNIYLSNDLGLGKPLRSTLEGLIRYSGGVLQSDVTSADLYIGRYRDGVEYIRASRAGKTVASLAWLYHVINRNRWSDPTKRLLHYPVPKNGIEGFQNMRISVSNYSGESRIYLENLIRNAGAEFTKTMKQDNTHLITAHKKSEKVEAAEEWAINVINHLWLEESYSKCRVMPMSVSKYTVFPARTNLGEVCGQMGLDMEKVAQNFFPRDPPPQKSMAKPSPRKSVPASSVIADRTSFSSRDIHMPDVPMDQTEDAITEDEEPTTTKKPRGRPPKAATATPRHLSDEKENETPSRTSDRKSKSKANDALSAYGPDIALYEREMKRKGGVIHGGRRSSHLEDFSSPAPAAPPEKNFKKRPSGENTYDVTAQGSDLSDGETQKPSKANKKAKTSRTSGGNNTSLPPIEERMMVTGDDRWLGKLKQEDQDRSKLRMLGVQLTQDPKEVTILVAPKILRTPKFVCALASAPRVVDTKYLDAALKQNKLIENPSTLHDRDAEERMGFKLVDALERAKINKRNLFRGWNIFVSKDITGTFETFKNIILLNGGTPFMYQGRNNVNIPKRRIKGDPKAGGESQHQGEEDEYRKVYLVSGTSEPEKKLWKQFRDLAAKQDLEARIVKSDWLLNAAMSQQIVWKDMWELDESSA